MAGSTSQASPRTYQSVLPPAHHHQVFRKVGVKGGKGASAGRPADTLAVLSSGIAFAAHSLLASGADLPVEEAAAEAHPGAGSSGGRGGVGAAAAGGARLRVVV